MSCMNEILACLAANQYKIPHMGKSKLEKAGEFPVILYGHPSAATLMDELDDPEVVLGEDDLEEDIQLSNGISKRELQELHNDAEVSDGSLDSWESDEE